MDRRQERGYQIAKTCQIVKRQNNWVVPSQSNNTKSYVVDENFVCDCPDSQTHNITCKHAYAVRYMLQMEIVTPNGVQTKRITYQQTWSVYDKCQINEKDSFLSLLNDLCKEIEETPNTRGRPKISNKDLLFASALKVYTQFSLRRFMSDLRMAKAKGYVEAMPCFASVGHFMQKEELTPILKQLVYLSSLPLRVVETTFAVDSSGFRTTKFSEYCNQKHKQNRHHTWLKAHICCGVKTNVITAVEISDEHRSDTPLLDPLMTTTRENGFKVDIVTADKAYASEHNFVRVDELGGLPFIPFKRNTRTPATFNMWQKMYGFFIANQDKFMEIYHKRSNVESTFFMLKAKFGDGLKSKSRTAQINELLLKVLCHNIVVVNNGLISGFIF